MLISGGKPWQRIRKRAHIDGTLNIHCLRHAFASWAVMGGLSLAQAGALLGRKLSQTTLRYADHLTEAIREYSEKTADHIAARWRDECNVVVTLPSLDACLVV